MFLKTEVLQQYLELDLAFIDKGIGPENTKKEASAYLLQKNFLKKFSDTKSTKLADANALRLFLSVNSKVGEWRLPVDGIELTVLKRAKEILARESVDYDGFSLFNFQRIGNRGRVGPGAAIGAAGTNLFEKLFNGPLSATCPFMHKWYECTIGSNPHWKAAELTRSALFGADDDFACPGTKMFFVPKNADISRTAGTEATLNMFFQLGIGSIITDILSEKHGINIESSIPQSDSLVNLSSYKIYRGLDQQRTNRWYARAGSLNDRFCTVDMSSASDTNGCSFCEWIIPPRVMYFLNLTRSKNAVLPDGSIVPLNMVSTMGNGFTFPLETWIFAALTKAVYEVMGCPVRDPHYKHARQYSVFGDDIICLSEAIPLLFRTLKAAGFTVNTKKSCTAGPFRESCGGDYFKGYDVRAVEFKKCTSPHHVYSIINRLLDWVIKSEIDLPNVFRYLLTLVPYRPIPLYEEENGGIRTPLVGLRGRKVDQQGWFVYHPLVPVARKTSLPASVVEEMPNACLITFLFGSLSCRFEVITTVPFVPRIELLGVDLSVREIEPTIYKSVKRSNPTYWDFTPNPSLTAREIEQAWLENIEPALKT